MNYVFKLFSALVVAAMVLFPIGCSEGPGWAAVDAMIRSRFPEITQISTDSLDAWLGDSTKQQPVLLDVRASDEFAVSHLPGALRIDPASADLSVFDSLDREMSMVAYCSVGYRSAEMVMRLQEAGFKNVSNLKGSIFKWANEGRPVYRDGERVWEVHPYDRMWGRLLEKRLHARR